MTFAKQNTNFERGNCRKQRNILNQENRIILNSTLNSMLTIDKKKPNVDKNDIADIHSMSHINDSEALLKPGDLLKQAREKANLTQKEVALKLKLSLNFIQMIEENRFDQLPSRVFARGYLCSYARFLQISEEKILQHFNAGQFAAHEVQIQNLGQSIGKLGRMDRKHFNLNSPVGFSPKLWFSLILGALLLSIFIFWLQKNAHKEDLIDAMHHNDSKQDAKQVASSSSPEVADNNSLKNDTEKIKQNNLAESSIKDSLPLISIPEINTLQKPDNLPKQELPVDHLFNHLEEVSQEKQPLLQKEEQKNPPDLSTTATKHRIRLSFTNSTWIELKQKHDIIKAGILNKNDQIDLEISTPFSLILGKAEVTSLRIDNQPIDINNLAINNVVRLHINKEADLANLINKSH